MDSRTLTAQVAVIVLLAVTVTALYLGVDADIRDRPGISLQMPAEAGEWQGEQIVFCHSDACRWMGLSDEVTEEGACPECGLELFSMALVEKQQLPGDTQFLKYRYVHPGGRAMIASIVLGGSERNSIHRPQRCLVAQGFQITASTVERIDLPGRGPLQVMQLDTLYHRPAAGGRTTAVPIPYAYWFIGQDRETPYHLVRMFWLAWDRVWHSVAHQWAYVMIQSAGGVSDEQFLLDLREFMPGWYPQVVE